MCPSMGEDVETYPPKPKKPAQNHEKNPNKYFNQFLYKAIIVAIFLVIVPFFPSQAPEFVNQNLQYSRSWELLQLIFVGIAVSYGLFSKRNDDATNKEHHGSTTLDNAQSYVARLLQVSSVFDDDSENTTTSVISEDHNKIHAWNLQYHREEPPVLQERNEKPLLLPVRRLKSRVSKPEMVGESPVKNPGQGKLISSSSGKSRNGDFPGLSVRNPDPEKLFSSNSGKSRNGDFPGLSVRNPDPEKRLSSNSGKSRNGDFPGLSHLDTDKNLDQANVVLRSPIPWRSRSGRMEIREQDDQDNDRISMENSELKKIEMPRSVRSQSSSSSKRLSPSHSFSSESQSRSSEDMVRKNFNVKTSSPPPPAPPPPPPLPPFYLKSRLEKSNSSLDFLPPPGKRLKRSVRSVPNEFIMDHDSGPELRTRAQSVRTIRPAEAMPKFRRRRLTSTELQMEKEKEVENLEKVMLETDGDSSGPEHKEDDFFEESVAGSEGPDVDKKADEFIAKFREQIRLQRIESIRRSTDQIARKHTR